MTARWHFGATKLDRRVAKVIARNATPAVERPAKLLTWAADEHLLLAVSAGLWLASRAADERERKQTDHMVLSVDAFPSGHAMHVGAVASAISWAFPKSAPLAWGVGGLVAATRIVLLAHWTTDVLAGLAMGALVERCLRPFSPAGATRTDPHPGFR